MDTEFKKNRKNIHEVNNDLNDYIKKSGDFFSFVRNILHYIIYHRYVTLHTQFCFLSFLTHFNIG